MPTDWANFKKNVFAGLLKNAGDKITTKRSQRSAIIRMMASLSNVPPTRSRSLTQIYLENKFYELFRNKSNEYRIFLPLNQNLPFSQ